METLDEWVQPTVDPEVRAYVSSLVTAVGGSSVEDDGRYVLGDEALSTLKDLRRWLMLYDQRLNRYDVARCLAEANLVQGDLLEILSQWPEEQTDNVLKQKIALSCLELLVPLTWPYEVKSDEMTVNHHRHLPYLRLAQARYKRAILHHDSAKILRTAVRVGLPSMAQPRRERSPRDEAIIRIVLYFLRNVAMITQPPRLPSEGDECEISRSATIEAFHDQDIFPVLLTISSSMGDEFVLQDVIILEILFHLLKGIDAEKLFMKEENVNKKHTEEFKNILKKEKSMLASQAKYAPTRHNRFGTMIWVKRDDDKVSTVSGQDVLGRGQKGLEKMDKTKKWNKPKHRGRAAEEHTERDEFDKPVHISASARKHLRAFVEEFLDSSFNPLFIHIRKAIELESSRVQQDVHPTQFFYLVSWFLKAECARRREATEAAKAANNTISSDDESFGLIAGVMNQETFILLNRYLQRGHDEKAWQDVNACMKCFTEILLTVQEMAVSPVEDDQDIAENIQNRIFYEESTHDRIIQILRTYKDQGFGYLDSSTELAHVFIRMLERYSKQNVDLQVRSKRRARKKRKDQEQADGTTADTADNGSEAEDLAEAQRTTSERKFDFARFAARFMTQKCVDTFVSLARFYNDLNLEQLKRAHRFFYRLAFKNELAILLFRVDILQLFHKMIKGPEGLDPELPCFKEWEELVKQIFRKAVNKIKERPELVVEMLFSKIPATLFYLEHGYEEERVTRAPRPPAELEVKPGMTREEQIGVAVGLLVNQNKADALQWVKDTLTKAKDERKSWEDLEEARKATADVLRIEDGEGESAVGSVEKAQAPSITVEPGSEERRVALFKDNKLRLLLKLVGFERLGLPEDSDASWIIPSSLTSGQLDEALRLVSRFEFDPPTYEDGKTAENFVQTKAAAARSQPRRRRASFDDDSSGPDDQDPEEFLYPAGGPTARKSDALESLKKKRRKRKETEEVDDEEKKRKAEKRRENELAKRRKIKSEMFVRDSDDETDEEADKEFFAKEEQRRLATRNKIHKALVTGQPLEEIDANSKKRRKPHHSKAKKKRRRSGSESGAESPASDIVISDDEAGDTIQNAETSDDGDGLDTPLSSPQTRVNKRNRIEDSDEEMADAPLHKAPDKLESSQGAGDADADEDDEVVGRRAARRTVRAGFVIDSDSE